MAGVTEHEHACNTSDLQNRLKLVNTLKTKKVFKNAHSHHLLFWILIFDVPNVYLSMTTKSKVLTSSTLTTRHPQEEELESAGATEVKYLQSHNALNVLINQPC